jgi:precorrin-3B methylase
MRENQRIVFIRLDQLHPADIGMQTVLFVGSGSTVQCLDFIFTSRGYTKKYAVTSVSTAIHAGFEDQEV